MGLKENIKQDARLFRFDQRSNESKCLYGQKYQFLLRIIHNLNIQCCTVLLLSIRFFPKKYLADPAIDMRRKFRAPRHSQTILRYE